MVLRDESVPLLVLLPLLFVQLLVWHGESAAVVFPTHTRDVAALPVKRAAVASATAAAPSLLAPPLAQQCDFVRRFVAGTGLDVPSACCGFAHGHNRIRCDTPTGGSSSSDNSIVEVDFWEVPVSAPLPPQLCDELPHLRILTLYKCDVRGALPPTLARCPALELLDLRRNELNGTLPRDWSAMTQLAALALGHNQLTGPIPGEWSGMARLQGLWLSFNRLDGQLPVSLQTIAPLTSIDLSHNAIGGTLPPEWGAMDLSRVSQVDWMTVRGSLDLSHNAIGGTLPAQWGTQPMRVRELRLGYNRIAGTLPPEWGGLRVSEVLDMERNALWGPLPGTWSASNCAISLRFNALTGALPSSWRFARVDLRYNLVERIEEPIHPDMQWLVLTGNRVRGPVPCPSRLDTLALGGNQLSGAIPHCYNDQQSWKRSLRLLLNFNNVTGFPTTLNTSDITELSIADTPVTALPRIRDLPPQLFALYASNAKIAALPDDFDVAATVLPRLCVLDLRNNGLSINTTALGIARVARDISVLDLSLNALHSSDEMIPLNGQPAGWSQRQCPLPWAAFFDATSTLPDFPGFHFGAAAGVNIVSRWEARATKTTRTLPQAMSEDYGVLPGGSGGVPCSVICAPDVIALDRVQYDTSGLALSDFGFQMLINDPHFADADLRACGCDVTPTTLLENFDAVATLRLEPSLGFAWEGQVRPLRPAPSGMFAIERLPGELPFDVPFALRVDITLFGQRFQFTTVKGQVQVLRAKPLTALTDPVARVACSSAEELAISNTTLCFPCPEHTACNGSSTALADDGYWRPSIEYITLERCEMQGCRVSATRGPRRQGWECADGYGGLLCSVCNMGFEPLGARCVPCFANHHVGAFVVTLIMLGLVAVVTIFILLEIRLEDESNDGVQEVEGQENENENDGGGGGVAGPATRGGGEPMGGFSGNGSGGGVVCAAEKLSANSDASAAAAAAPRVEGGAGGKPLGASTTDTRSSDSSAPRDSKSHDPKPLASSPATLEAPTLSPLHERLLAPFGLEKKVASLKEHAPVAKRELLFMIKMLVNHFALTYYVLTARAVVSLVGSTGWIAVITTPGKVTRMHQLRVYLRCILGADAIDFLFVIWPVLITLFLSCFGIVQFLSRFPSLKIPPPRTKWRSMLAIIMLLYADTAFDIATAPLGCDRSTFHRALGGHTTFFTMRVDHGIECSGTRYYVGLSAAIVEILLAIVGVPFFCVVMYRQLRRAKGEQHAIATFEFMCGNYRVECWWWELVLLCRKNLCVVVLVSVQDPVLQLVGLNVVLVLFLVAHQRVGPYNTPNFNRNDTFSMLAAIFVVNVALAFFRNEVFAPEYGVAFLGLVSLAVLVPFVGTAVVHVQTHIHEHDAPSCDFELEGVPPLVREEDVGVDSGAAEARGEKKVSVAARRGDAASPST